MLGRMTGDSDSRREKDNDSLLSLGRLYHLAPLDAYEDIKLELANEKG